MVAAILAVAARGPLAEPDVFHAASGARNPLRYRQLVDLVRAWFIEHPAGRQPGPADHRAGVVVPRPATGCSASCARPPRPSGTAEKALQALPLRGRQAELSARLEERRDEAERALSYVELYGAYTETEAVFSVDRLLELFSTLPARGPAGLLFRPGRHRLAPLLPRRLPARRWSPTPGSAWPPAGGPRRSRQGPTGLTREERGRRAVLAPERQLAVFDLENTLIASNVVDSYAWLATRHPATPSGPASWCGPCGRRPGCWPSTAPTGATSCATSTAATRARRWTGCARDSWELFSDLVLTKSFPAGIRRVREHRALGHKTLLITGALDVVIEPLRPLFDEVVCARLGTKSGRFTGELLEAPPTGRGPGPDHGRLRPGPPPRPRAERGLRRLGQRPAHAGGGRPPGGGQPRDQAGRHRPQAGLARRALAQGARRAPPAAADRAPADDRRLRS